MKDPQTAKFFWLGTRFTSRPIRGTSYTGGHGSATANPRPRAWISTIEHLGRSISPVRHARRCSLSRRSDAVQQKSANTRVRNHLSRRGLFLSNLYKMCTVSVDAYSFVIGGKGAPTCINAVTRLIRCYQDVVGPF